MSGGAFDYQQYKFNEIADQIEQAIYENGSHDKHSYSFDTIAEFRKATKILAQAFVYAHRIDWLLSGDDGEGTFHVRLAKDLKKIQENQDD